MDKILEQLDQRKQKCVMGHCTIYVGYMKHSFPQVTAITYVVRHTPGLQQMYSPDDYAVCWDFSSAVHRAIAANLSQGKTWESINYHSAPSSFKLWRRQ